MMPFWWPWWTASQTLAKELETAAGVEGFVAGIIGDRAGAGDQLHGEVGHTGRGAGVSGELVDAGFVNLGQVRMPQPPEDVRLELEPPQRLRRHETSVHDLQGNGALGLVLHRLVDRCHAARGDDALYLEVADPLADEQLGIRGGGGYGFG